MRSLLAVTVVIGGATTAHADDPCACSPAKPGFSRADALTGDWNGLRDRWAKDGVSISTTYTSETFAATRLDRPVVLSGLGALVVDLDLALLAHDGLGTLHASGFVIHGRGLTDELADVYGISGNTAPPDVRLFEAWLEQPLGPFAIRAGLLSADQEFIIADHSTVLVNATFGIISQLSYNVLGPVYPVAAPGVSIHVHNDDTIEGRVAVYEGSLANARGIPSALDGALVIVEVAAHETVKLGAWHHTDRGDGYYAVVDRQLARRFGAFARIGYSPDGVVDEYADVGLRLGPLRDGTDFASFGMAYAGTTDPMIGKQTVLEATYQWHVRGWLSIQPDVQLLLARERAIPIIGTRITISI